MTDRRYYQLAELQAFGDYLTEMGLPSIHPAREYIGERADVLWAELGEEKNFNTFIKVTKEI